MNNFPLDENSELHLCKNESGVSKIITQFIHKDLA